VQAQQTQQQQQQQQQQQRQQTLDPRVKTDQQDQVSEVCLQERYLFGFSVPVAGLISGSSELHQAGAHQAELSTPRCVLVSACT
jgi:transcription initiation factor TFIID subunit TAF12